MVVSRDKAPSAQETFLQMAQAAGLRGRLLVTVGMLILVRLGVFIPVPGIDREAFQAGIEGNALGGIIGFLDIFSGGGLSALGIFALGILPYINASIIIQLLTAAIPQLEDLQKNEGEAGRRKISQITRYVALGWAILQSSGIAWLVRQYAETQGPIFVVQTVLALTAGSMFVMWVGELITERGIGNGASLLIFINIVSTLPRSLGQTIELAQSGDRSLVGGVIILLLVFLAMIVGIVFVQEGTRRIPIISARRQVGRKLYLEKSSYLPLRLNQGGVMPIIFASAVLILPASLANVFPGEGFSQAVNNYLTPGSWTHTGVYLVLILFFSYFYASLIVNPVDMSQNLKKMGSSIPGIRPGRATSEYIERVLNRLTFLGAIFLGLVAIIPTAVEGATQVRTFQGLGATSLLILVGVAIDTAKQVQTYVISQRYEGMVKQ
jgi:preprotein translocase subunit SecY